jgi:hypothetical protein
MDLSLVEIVLSHNLHLFLFSILLDLLDNLFIILLLSGYFLLKLLSYRDLSLHLSAMSIHQLIDCQIVFVNNLSDCVFETPCFLVFFYLQILEFLGIFKHSLRVNVPAFL